MSMWTQLRALLLLMVVLTLPSCGGGENKAAKAEVLMIPEKPLVINADVKIGEETITAPWFAFTMKMANNTAEKFTIVVVQLEINGQNEQGLPTTSTVALAPGEFNDSVKIGDDTYQCEYNSFGTWEVGEERALILDGARAECYGYDNGVRLPKIPYFYITNNPRGPGNNFRYRVKMKPLGWFGTFLEPTSRFEKAFYFSTQ